MRSFLVEVIEAKSIKGISGNTEVGGYTESFAKGRPRRVAN